MEKIIIDSNEEKLTGYKVRYFSFQNENYIIFTLKEIDDEEYEKLYITKIVDEEEEYISDLEWEELKKNIPLIVKEIKNNDMKNIVDLDIDLIDKINIKYSKPFKLKSKIVDSITKQKASDTIKQIDEELKSIMDNFNTFEEQKKEDSSLEEFNYEEEEKDDNDLVETPLNPNVDKQNKNLLEEELKEEKEKNEKLQARIDDLEEKVKKYQQKLDKIKIMIIES